MGGGAKFFWLARIYTPGKILKKNTFVFHFLLALYLVEGPGNEVANLDMLQLVGVNQETPT